MSKIELVQTEVPGGRSVMSSDGRYRYLLTRRWDGHPGFEGTVVWIGLNPSTADARIDDPTVRRCTGFSRAWGYAGLSIVNLFAYRSTSPQTLRYEMGNGVVGGVQNDEYILGECKAADLVVAAWGQSSKGRFVPRIARVLSMLDLEGVTLYALRVNKDGAPGHPLYQKKTLRPFVYEWRQYYPDK